MYKETQVGGYMTRDLFRKTRKGPSLQREGVQYKASLTCPMKDFLFSA